MPDLSAPNSLTRRGFLTMAGGATAGLLTGCSEPVEEGNWIDAHVHVWTTNLDKYPLAEGFARKDMVPSGFTPAELFAWTKPNGVSRVVLIQMSFYGTDNRYMLDVMAEHPGVFSGVAVIDENGANVPALMKTHANHGVRGFRLYASEENAATWSDSEGMKAMWKTGAEEGLAMCCLADPGALPHIQKMCTAFPETPVVIDHFARIGMRGPVDQAELDQLLSLADFPTVHVKTSAFYALGAKAPPYTDLAPMIRQLRDAYGADRLMWATDCPYQLEGGHSYEASIALVRDELDFLTDRERQQMLRGTAERVFFS